MPRVSEEHSEARREQILGAALRCFGRKGVHRTTVRDICAEAGLSAGAVYSYFPSKKDIIEAVFDLSLLNNERLFSMLADIEDPVEAIETVRAMSFGSTDDPESQEFVKAGLSLILEAIRDPRLAKRYSVVHRDTAQRLGSLVAAGQESGEADSDFDAELAGRLLLAILDGWRIQKLIDPRLDTSAFLKTLDLLLRLHPTRGGSSSESGGNDES